MPHLVCSSILNKVSMISIRLYASKIINGYAIIYRLYQWNESIIIILYYEQTIWSTNRNKSYTWENSKNQKQLRVIRSPCSWCRGWCRSLENQLTSQKVVLICTEISLWFSDNLIRSVSSIRHSCFLLWVSFDLIAITTLFYCCR